MSNIRTNVSMSHSNGTPLIIFISDVLLFTGKQKRQVSRSACSDINGFDIILAKTCSTDWAFTVTGLKDFLNTAGAEQVVAFCDNNLIKEHYILSANIITGLQKGFLI